jgi:hypothetical protein
MRTETDRVQRAKGGCHTLSRKEAKRQKRRRGKIRRRADKAASDGTS